MFSKPVLTLGALTATSAKLFECPFGHSHDVPHHHEASDRPAYLQTMFTWGILDSRAPAKESSEPISSTPNKEAAEHHKEHHHKHHHEHEHKEYKCPIRQFFQDEKEKFESYHDKIEDLFEDKQEEILDHMKALRFDIKDFSGHKEEHEHKTCPFMKFFEDKLSKPWIDEDHDTPFYDVDSITNSGWDTSKPEGTPTAVFHGLGDACIYPGMKSFTKEISEGTNAPAHCIEVGLPTFGEYFNSMETISQKSCDKLAKNADFQGEFNVVGLSQGGLLARYIVEECDMKGKVRNMLTIGGPHMGVDAVPNCTDGMLCSLLNAAARKLVYLKPVQNWLAPAGYFRDVRHMKTYEKDSVFLPAMNNEHEAAGSYAAMRKSRFSDLNAAMLVMFDQDSIVYPKQSSWFQTLDDKAEKVLPLNATAFYNDDYIGLKSLVEADKVDFVSIDGNHLQFTDDDVQNTFIPFLNK